MRRAATTVVTVSSAAALFVGLAPTAAAAPHALTAPRTAPLLSAAVTAPTVPTALTATRDDATASATVAWKPPTSTGGSAITGYRVARDGIDSAGAGPWSGTVAATATSFRFTKLLPGRTYTLTVAAVNSAGAGTATSVQVVLGVPTTPTTVTVTKNDSAKTATLGWAPPTSTGGSAVTGYRVSRDGTDSTGKGAYSTTVAATARALTFTALVPGQTYSVTVVALNARGAGDAAVRTVALATAPSPANAVTATSGTSTTATLTWSPPTSTGGSAVTGYRVSRDGTDSTGKGPWSGTVAATTGTFTFANLVAGSTYAPSVAAVNAAGTSVATTQSVYVVPMATTGDYLLRKTTVAVDPHHASLVVTLTDGSRRRFTMGTTDQYQDLMSHEMTRVEFVGQVAGVQDWFRINHRTLPAGSSAFLVSNPAPYDATSGYYWEHREDNGVDVTVDPSGSFLVLHGNGPDPVTGEDLYGTLLLRFELKDASTYSYSLRDYATGGEAVHSGVSRAEFVRLMTTHEAVREIEFTYDDVTDTGSFVVTGQVNEP